MSGLKFTFEDPLTPGATEQAWLLLVLGGVVFPMIVILIYMVHQLRRTSATFAAGKPFVHDNVGRIRRIAGAVLVWAVVARIGSFAAAYYVMDHVRISGVRIDAVLTPNLSMIFVGLVILVLAEVFRMGVSLQEDHDLTI